MASASARYSLEIASGLYRGVKLELGEGRHVVGGEDADVVLLEDTVHPSHAAIILSADTIRVEGLADDVVVESAGPVPPGSARTVLLPAAVRIGDVTTVWRLDGSSGAENPLLDNPAVAKLRDTVHHDILPRLNRFRERFRREVVPGSMAAAGDTIRDVGEASGVRSRLRHPGMLGVAVATILLATVFWSILNGDGGASARAGRAIDSTAPASPLRPSVPTPTRAAGETTAPLKVASAGPIDLGRLAPALPVSLSPLPKAVTSKSAQVAPPSPKGPGDHIVEAAATLRGEVAKAGLVNVVVDSGNGAVTATGSVEPEMSTRWQSAQEGFDARYGGDVTLVNSVVVRAEKLPPSIGIEGVWRGARPYILVRGQRYQIGAVLDGGWAIRSIEGDRVMLEHNGRTVAMRY